MASWQPRRVHLLLRALLTARQMERLFSAAPGKAHAAWRVCSAPWGLGTTQLSPSGGDEAGAFQEHHLLYT